MINYITTLNVNEHSGGWSGMNHNVYRQLREKNAVNLVQEINPKYNLGYKALSKALRVAGFRGIFPAYTSERLNRIKRLVEPKLNPNADFNFFHGSTPWLNVVLDKPYGAYLDACFATYIEIYHTFQKFSRAQLDRLYKREAEFLNNARAIFFSSRWALDETKRKYEITGSNFHVAGLGGGFTSAVSDYSSPEKYFLFVGLDFIGKGGAEVITAFNEVSKEHDDFRLKIAGERPPDDVLMHKSVEYIGFIDKTTPEGSKQLGELFAGAYCFVLPTVKDLTPLVLVEAGSVGCPVISTRSFGIPEIVKENVTGILLNPGNNLTEQMVIAMKSFCSNRKMRDNMSGSAKIHISENFTWARTGSLIDEVLANAKK